MANPRIDPIMAIALDLKALDERLCNYVIQESKLRKTEPHVIIEIIVEKTGELRAAALACEVAYGPVLGWAIAMQESGRQWEL